MLGLGNSIIKYGKVKRLIYEYTSSFDTSVSGFEVYQCVGCPDPGEFTIEYGQNAPGEATTNDWLKVTLGGDGDETAISGTWTGFRISNTTDGHNDWLPSEYSSGRVKGDIITLEYKIQLGGDWHLDRDPVKGLKNSVGGNTQFLLHNGSVSIPKDTTASISTEHVMGGNYWNQQMVFPVAGLYPSETNYPAPGSIFYFKDVVARLYRI